MIFKTMNQRCHYGLDPQSPKQEIAGQARNDAMGVVPAGKIAANNAFTSYKLFIP